MTGCCKFSALVSKARNNLAIKSATKGLAFGIVYLGCASLVAAEVEPISVNHSGTDMGNEGAWRAGYEPAISHDGRFVAFASRANDLAPGLDRNGTYDVFVRDRLLGSTELLSTDVSGTRSGNDFSVNPTLSADGRFIAFWSAASDLVDTDTNEGGDVFLRDRTRGTTRLVSANRSGTDSGNGASSLSILTMDGSSVMFVSRASDLVAVDTNGAADLFAWDRATGVTVLVSINASGTDSSKGDNALLTDFPSVSADGRRIAFVSNAVDLVPATSNGFKHVFLRDRATQTTSIVSKALAGGFANGDSTRPSISADGSVVVFGSVADDLVATDTNQTTDAFARDVNRGTTHLISIAADGADSVPGGAFVLVPPGVSSDGTLVAFMSFASSLVPDDTNETIDAFLHDRTDGTTRLISATPAGSAGKGPSFVSGFVRSPFSADGRFVVFSGSATNLTNATDTNRSSDVFRRDLQSGVTVLLSASLTGDAGDVDSFFPTISADGTSVAFFSNATNLAPVDTNGLADVFAATPTLLFEDGFESGDTAAWSVTVP